MTDLDIKRKLKQIFDEHSDALRRYAWYKVGNEIVADDLVQDAFVKLWAKRKSIVWDKSIGLLYKMIENLAHDHHKHRKVVLSFENKAKSNKSIPGPDYELEYEQFRSHLERCISMLPDGQRETFLMSRMDSMKYREIAEFLKITVKGVEKRMGIAIKALTECVGQRI